jgi:hypothetical protein
MIITIQGKNFTKTGNYLSFVANGMQNTNYNFIANVDSTDGKTLSVQISSSTIAWFTYTGGYKVAVANADGTSNTVQFTTR